MSVSEAAEEDVAARAVERTPEDLPSVPCHLFLPVVPAARVIGKGGASIRAIREQSGASVKVLQKELPQDMQRREDRVAVIEGTPEQVQEAISAVLERVFDRSGLPEAADTRQLRERALIIEALVPEKSGSHLIGQRGERIRALCEETFCDINVVKEPITGLADQKRVRIAGNSLAEVSGAVWRLQEVLGELVAGGVLRLPDHFELRETLSSTGGGPAAPSFSASTFGRGGGGGGASSSFGGSRGGGGSQKEVPIRILVAQEEAAWIVGKRGNKISLLRDLAKVHMNDADAPPFDPSERLLEISAAPLENRLRVVQMVLEDLGLRQEASDELRLLVPTEQFGSVMGHRGETLRGIIQSTKAKVQQHKAEVLKDGQEYRFRLVEIIGTESQRIQAVKQIYDALENKNRDSGSFSGPDLVGAGYGAPGGNMSSLGLGLAGALAGAKAASAAPPGNGGVLGSLGGAQRTLGHLGGAGAAGGGSTADLGQLTLQLAMPSEEVARTLAGESSGIAWRAGVKLSTGRGAGGLPVLKVSGTAVGNSVACYLIQDRLFMMH